jgi:hypothetical protein
VLGRVELPERHDALQKRAGAITCFLRADASVLGFERRPRRMAGKVGDPEMQSRDRCQDGLAAVQRTGDRSQSAEPVFEPDITAVGGRKQPVELAAVAHSEAISVAAQQRGAAEKQAVRRARKTERSVVTLAQAPNHRYGASLSWMPQFVHDSFRKVKKIPSSLAPALSPRGGEGIVGDRPRAEGWRGDRLCR